MGCNGLTRLVTAYALFVLGAAEAVALTPADKCEANKLKIAGKYGFCRLKAESKAVKTASSPDYSLCDLKLSEKWTTAETVGGGQCPTNGDLADIQSQATEDTDFLALKLTGVRYVDNGDGTVSDTQTGLMWEKKDELGGIHDKYNLYDWSATATAPDGEAFTIFLATLNNGTSTDGTTISGCFAIRAEPIRASIRSSAPRSPTSTGRLPP